MQIRQIKKQHSLSRLKNLGGTFMKKPIIGITSAYEKTDGLVNYYKAAISIDYSNSVILSSGIPLIIPTSDNVEVIKEQLSLLDGLIVSGGADVNPIYYGEDFKVGIAPISPQRDTCELIIIEEFLKTQKPILGICRGHQLLNVFFKGSLYQDIGRYYKTDIKHSQDLYPDLPTHKVKIIEKDNMLYQLYGEEIYTNSFHHQIVNKLGEGLTAIAQSDDGVIEAFQMKTHKFLYGVQWHPEMMTARGNKEMQRIFEEFIDATK